MTVMKNFKTYNIITSRTQAHLLYKSTLDRLLNDVAIPMQYYRITGNGNWSSMRMICPVIEALAKNDTNRRNSILKLIGISYPAIFWAMYRHGLMHNDSAPQSVQLEERSIGWGFNWGQNEAAIMVGNNYSLNPSVIFDNLIHWLRAQLANRQTLERTTIEEAMIVKIKQNKNSALKQEFIDITNNQQTN